ncbi:uncharacterized protein LOC123314936 [Coccinella septempunctata]|uniref:uncharacterized protein LOC123314936 n=1 Tax=Coccinella septempunctata TaxID=41139 RepID=UPI001D08928A|nr:uncharacterized protein LOC123314936 [Coccinella septempunctata]
MDFALLFRIMCLIGFTLLSSAATKKSKEDKSQIPEEEDDLTREEQNYSNHYTDNLAGAPELDYPIFTSIPRTGFTCEGKVNWQYYADIETDCQVFHVCESQHSKISFLCPEGSIFNQRHLVCDWWYNVDCTDSFDLFLLKENYNVQDLTLQNIADPGDFDLNLASTGGNKGPNGDRTDEDGGSKSSIKTKSKTKQRREQ